MMDDLQDDITRPLDISWVAWWVGGFILGGYLYFYYFYQYFFYLYLYYYYFCIICLVFLGGRVYFGWVISLFAYFYLVFLGGWVYLEWASLFVFQYIYLFILIIIKLLPKYYKITIKLILKLVYKIDSKISNLVSRIGMIISSNYILIVFPIGSDWLPFGSNFQSEILLPIFLKSNTNWTSDLNYFIQ